MFNGVYQDAIITVTIVSVIEAYSFVLLGLLAPYLAALSKTTIWRLGVLLALSYGAEARLSVKI